MSPEKGSGGLRSGGGGGNRTIPGGNMSDCKGWARGSLWGIGGGGGNGIVLEFSLMPEPLLPLDSLEASDCSFNPFGAKPGGGGGGGIAVVARSDSFKWRLSVVVTLFLSISLPPVPGVGGCVGR